MKLQVTQLCYVAYEAAYQEAVLATELVGYDKQLTITSLKMIPKICPKTQIFFLQTTVESKVKTLVLITRLHNFSTMQPFPNSTPTMPSMPQPLTPEGTWHLHSGPNHHHHASPGGGRRCTVARIQPNKRPMKSRSRHGVRPTAIQLAWTQDRDPVA